MVNNVKSIKVPFDKTLFIYTDGASRGNPGHAAFSVFYRDDTGREYYKHSEDLGKKPIIKQKC